VAQLKYATHFCGLGGACNGIEQAGLKATLAIDNNGDGPCIQTRAANLKCDKGICIDIRDYFKQTDGKFDYARDEHRDDLFLLWTSPPCKKFSVANKGSKKDLAMENLYQESLKFVEWARPKFVIMENVKGMIKHEAISKSQGTVGKLSEIRTAFEALGYTTEFNVLDSSDWGVAQKRERVFIVASREKKTGLIPAVPKKKRVFFSDIREHGAVAYGLGGKSYWTMNEKLTKLIKKNGAFKIKILGLKDQVGSGYDFLPTITCGFGGGITRKKCAVIDCVKVKSCKKPLSFLRHPTLLEAVRAQGFPDGWMQVLNDVQATQAWAMVGNAVPSPVSNALVDHLVKVDRGETPTVMLPYKMKDYEPESDWEWEWEEKPD
jgi:DNA (cytosine-5)-methyltransferase 1